MIPTRTAAAVLAGIATVSVLVTVAAMNPGHPQLFYGRDTRSFTLGLASVIAFYVVAYAALRVAMRNLKIR